ncbi:unnamed protein product [Rangifer tarandus platyrhynchus]|uniref:Uncharacterized protein n=1 Tax=Rangifer tarandus platyrhynchus TaxID=3082113 RepID=A0ABN8Y1G0_RANTA|nr:unnamed protein product [Rangifer tarandus platyrhynchus]
MVEKGAKGMLAVEEAGDASVSPGAGGSVNEWRCTHSTPSVHPRMAAAQGPADPSSPEQMSWRMISQPTHTAVEGTSRSLHPAGPGEVWAQGEAISTLEVTHEAHDDQSENGALPSEATRRTIAANRANGATRSSLY